MIKIISNIDQVIDFAWKINNDSLKSSFPREESIGKLRKTIDRYINQENHQGLAYYHNNILCAICLYFSLPEHKYVQTKLLFIDDKYHQAMDKFIDYIENKHRGYEFFITGIPAGNKDLEEYFLEKNIESIESSIVTKLDKLEPKCKKFDDLNEITLDNFDSYKDFHDKHAIPLEMFYNSKNLKNDMDRFKIYTYVDEGLIRGSIFAKIVKKDAEIFAIFIDDEYKDKNIGHILINKLLNGLYSDYGLLDKLIYFVDEDDDDCLKLVLENEFEIYDRLKTYKIIF